MVCEFDWVMFACKNSKKKEKVGTPPFSTRERAGVSKKTKKNKPKDERKLSTHPPLPFARLGWVQKRLVL